MERLPLNPDELRAEELAAGKAELFARAQTCRGAPQAQQFTHARPISLPADAALKQEEQYFHARHHQEWKRAHTPPPGPSPEPPEELAEPSFARGTFIGPEEAEDEFQVCLPAAVRTGRKTISTLDTVSGAEKD